MSKQAREALLGVGFTELQVDALLTAFSLRPKKKAGNPETAKVWEAYCAAYLARYKTEPVRNATVNNQIKQIVARLGAEAPEVIDFYVRHNASFYVRTGHAVGACLRDAESLRTQWATNRKITDRDARGAETQDHYQGQMDRVRRGEI